MGCLPPPRPRRMQVDGTRLFSVGAGGRSSAPHAGSSIRPRGRRVAAGTFGRPASTVDSADRHIGMQAVKRGRLRGRGPVRGPISPAPRQRKKQTSNLRLLPPGDRRRTSSAKCKRKRRCFVFLSRAGRGERRRGPQRSATSDWRGPSQTGQEGADRGHEGRLGRLFPILSRTDLSM